ncbi:hypothetical protein V7x_54240 [Crateriforma conspicua]|uniref:Uncharacterized protein n=1 Tax=Crateriforma conspicua TaxID=2527996 RepID=A0A5C6FM42_9PLAN|nr:hypothetical protein [Crateriforma conspicua]TWU61112.1 hypothetical protein V7x_54240 [Crateriforma conspicua]
MDEDAPELEYPKYQWPTSGWWFTIVGTLFGGIVFLAPNAIDMPILSRVLLFVAVAIAPAAVIFASTFLRRFVTFFRRGKNYEIALSNIAQLRDEISRGTQLTNLLLQERQNTRALQIEHGYYYDNYAYISLHRKKGFAVAVGDVLTVVDQTNGRNLGDFQITELKPKTYVGKATGDIDPLWLGYIVQTGTTPSAPPPDSLAIKFLINDEQNDA